MCSLLSSEVRKRGEGKGNLVSRCGRKGRVRERVYDGVHDNSRENYSSIPHGCDKGEQSAYTS